MKKIILTLIFLFLPVICQANTLIDALDRNTVLWKDWNIENVKTKSHNGPERLIIKNVKEHLQNIINKPGGFERLKTTINEKLQDYSQNPKGKYYSNEGFNVYFIIYGDIIAYFFSFHDKVFNWTQYNEIEVIYRLPLKTVILPLGDESFLPAHFSPVNVDIFEDSRNLYLFDWKGPEGSGHFSGFTLSTIKNSKISKLKSHGMHGHVVLYDFDKKILLTREWKEAIKQEWIHGAKAVYDIKYLIGKNIEKISEKCLNPWYLVVKEYIEAVWENDTKKAQQFVTDKDILTRTKNYKYFNPDIPIHAVRDDNWLRQNIQKETKIVYLAYHDYKHNISYYEYFYLKESKGKWKITDISLRNLKIRNK